MRKTATLLGFVVLFLVGLPLVGPLARREGVGLYLEFPPRTRYVPHAPFSWPVFSCLAVVGAALLLFLIVQLRPGEAPAAAAPKKAESRYPCWGLSGLLLVGVSWALSWNRFPWFTALQPYTFLPLWLGFIVSVNSITYYRTGACLMIKSSRYFLALFGVSGVFWWFFEYLNRFVQNWYYLGIESFGEVEYVFHASLCFSTVLPAVLSTEELLYSWARLSGPLMNSYPVHVPKSPIIPIGFLLSGAFGLAAISRWPDYLFPLLWLSPLIVILAVQTLSGQSTILSALARGDWRPVWLPALAALTCGFFWELWNVNSFAHWEYSVPYVQRVLIFKMPLVGFLGYLPFGLECKVVADLVKTTVS